jgi:hypothetical protein
LKYNQTKIVSDYVEIPNLVSGAHNSRQRPAKLLDFAESIRSNFYRRYRQERSINQYFDEQNPRRFPIINISISKARFALIHQDLVHRIYFTWPNRTGSLQGQYLHPLIWLMLSSKCFSRWMIPLTGRRYGARLSGMLMY